MLVSEGPVIATPINGGGPNPLCTNAVRQEPAGAENIRMVALSLTYGDFKFASLGDADWSREMELACPVNKLGTVNLYTINRHGGLDNSGAPALLGAIKPQVIVVNNGPRKGSARRTSAPGDQHGRAPLPTNRSGTQDEGHAGRGRRLAGALSMIEAAIRRTNRAQHDRQRRGQHRRSSRTILIQRHGHPRREVHADQRPHRIQQDLHRKEVTKTIAHRSKSPTLQPTSPSREVEAPPRVAQGASGGGTFIMRCAL